ncbi:MAG: sulfatase-like hydrolase/transferase, partial [Acidobacteriota bacterium]
HTWLRHDTEFADLFEVYVDLPTEIGADPKVSYPRAEIAVDHALEVIEQHRNDKLFLYIHLMEPHHPRFPEAEALELMPEGVDIEQAASGLFPGGFPRDRGRLLDPNERAYIDALYDGAVLQADKALDRLFTGLGEDLDDALVIVTSDHGENQLEVPGRWGHSGPWYDLVGRVPLILTAPGHIEPGRVSSLTEGIDLAPTVTRILGVPQPEEAVWDGQDLLAMKAGDFEPRSHAVMLGGIRTDAWKVLFEQPPEEIFPLDDLSTVRGVLYDLAADPLESVDVRFRHPEVFVELAQTWRDRLDRPFRRYSIGGVAKPPPGPFAIGARLLEVEDEEAIRTVDFAQWTEPGWQRSWRLHDTVVVAGRGTVPVSGWLPIPNGRYSLIAKVWGRGSLHVADLSLEIDEKRWNSRRPGINIPLGDVTVTDERLLISLAAERPGFALAHIGFVPAGTEDDPERREQLRALGYI